MLVKWFPGRRDFFFPLLGRSFMICFISSSNPTSKIRSASSITKHCKFLYMKPGVFYKINKFRVRQGQEFYYVLITRIRHQYFIYLHMIQQSSWCCYNDVDSVSKFLCFCWSVTAPHYQTIGVNMVIHKFFKNSIGLHGKLSSRRKNNNTRS